MDARVPGAAAVGLGAWTGERGGGSRGGRGRYVDGGDGVAEEWIRTVGSSLWRGRGPRERKKKRDARTAPFSTPLSTLLRFR